jgi:hypothetical protein
MHQNWCTTFSALYFCSVQVLYDIVHSILNIQIYFHVVFSQHCLVLQQMFECQRSQQHLFV